MKRQVYPRGKIGLGIAIAVGILVLPLPVRDSDRAHVVCRDALRLKNARPVWLEWQRRPFFDSQRIAREESQWVYCSDVDIDLRPLDKCGFRQLSETQRDEIDWVDWYDSGNVLVQISDRSAFDEDAPRGLRFNVHHGSMAGQGYTVHVYRCLLGTFAWYSIEWVS